MSKRVFWLLAILVLLACGLAISRIPKSAHQAGSRSENPAMVPIPAGSFMMGCSPGDQQCTDSEKPAHQVSVRAFWMNKTEITYEQYDRCAVARKCEAVIFNQSGPDRSDLLPATVTGQQAADYCRWIGGRLPTDAEWEYAARAGTTGPRYGALDEIAWYEGNAHSDQPVGQKKPNAWGLYDMLGNASEWAIISRPETAQPGEQPVEFRGGLLLDTERIRVSYGIEHYGLEGSKQGFRCVRDEDQQHPVTVPATLSVSPSPITPPGVLPPPGTMVRIPGGSFRMGCSPGDILCDKDENPVHSVTLKPFRLAATETTKQEYETCVLAGACIPVRNDRQGIYSQAAPNKPAVGVSWKQAATYCRWIGGRLPSEAEWEYAARAGTTSPHYADLDRIAWWRRPDSNNTMPVGQWQPNAWGLYDMVGNAEEWVADWYGADYYASSPADNPPGPSIGAAHIWRGGSFMSNAANLRVSRRGFGGANEHDFTVGFRCAQDDGSSVQAPAAAPPPNPTVSTSGMVHVPAGMFAMGCSKQMLARTEVTDHDECPSDQQPEHLVRLKSFWINATETTNEQYGKCVQAGACTPSHLARQTAQNQPTQPVVGIDWYQASAYCHWTGGRLPTEAEWEYAARAETVSPHYLADNPFDLAWEGCLLTDGPCVVRAVGKKEPNEWGLYDMIGNVWEWTADRYGPYRPQPADNPTGPSAGGLRVLRGGSIFSDFIYDDFWVTARIRNPARYWNNDVGFRCVRDDGEAAVAPAPVAPKPPTVLPKDMVLIPGGTYMMSCSPNDPDCREAVAEMESAPDNHRFDDARHRVTLDAFYLDEHEVTVADYAECVRAGACAKPRADDRERANTSNGLRSDRLNHPANGIDWEQAFNYCEWRQKRLPTEAEFEYVLRGGQPGQIYPWGNQARPPQRYGNYFDELGARLFPSRPAAWHPRGARDVSWFRGYDDGYAATSPVCSYPRNRYGLCDVSGNVAEWTADWEDQFYFRYSPPENPQGPSCGGIGDRSTHIIRGGSWFSSPDNTRAAFRRNGHTSDEGRSDVGFRCARDR